MAARLRSPEVGYGLLTVVASALVAAVTLRLWHATPGIPLTEGGDGYFTLMQIKGVVDNGWVLHNPHLGAPFGQDLHDFAGNRELGQMLIVKVLALFSSNPAAIYNAYYLLSFPLIGLAAYLVMRWLGVSRPAAAGMSVLYAVAPYHFRHATFLWAYYSVPLSAFLILAVYCGAPLFERRAGRSRWLLRYATRRSLATLAVAAVVALTSFYYAGFTVLLVLLASVIAFLVSRRPQALAAGAAIVGTILVIAALAQAPDLIYRAQHGGNPVASERNANESQFFSTNLLQLVMPVPGHRIEPLRELSARWSSESRIDGEPTHLGLVATIGFVWLLVVALAAAAGGAGRLIGEARQRHLAVAAVTAFLLGTTGGISGVIAYTVTTQLRTWTRLTIFIAFFALAAVGLLLDAARAALQRRGVRLPHAALGLALAAVCLLGVIEQTTSLNVPGYDANAAAYRSDDAFVEDIERVLPDDAMVLQLPYVPFPENQAIGGTGSYDHVRPYLHSRSLSWSFAAMKGRPADWQADTAGASPNELAPAIAAAGFDGVYVDRAAYPLFGGPIEAELREALGTPPLVSPDDRFSFFDLRPFARRLRQRLSPVELRDLADATVRPVRVDWSSGFGSRQQQGLDSARWAVIANPTVTVHNPSDDPRRTELFVKLARAGGAAAEVNFSFPDGTERTVSVPPDGVELEQEVEFPPGDSTIRIVTQGSHIAGGEGAPSGFFQALGWRLTPAMP